MTKTNNERLKIIFVLLKERKITCESWVELKLDGNPIGVDRRPEDEGVVVDDDDVVDDCVVDGGRWELDEDDEWLFDWWD